MRMQITQYGLSNAKDGWDGVGDPGTDAFKGNADNVIINGVSCALSPSARVALGNVPDGKWLVVTFANGVVYRRQVTDSTSTQLLNDRCDFFNAYAFDKQMDSFGGYADVVVEDLTPTTPAQHATTQGWLGWL